VHGCLARYCHDLLYFSAAKRAHLFHKSEGIALRKREKTLRFWARIQRGVRRRRENGGAQNTCAAVQNNEKSGKRIPQRGEVSILGNKMPIGPLIGRAVAH